VTKIKKRKNVLYIHDIITAVVMADSPSHYYGNLQRAACIHVGV